LSIQEKESYESCFHHDFLYCYICSTSFCFINPVFRVVNQVSYRDNRINTLNYLVECTIHELIMLDHLLVYIFHFLTKKRYDKNKPLFVFSALVWIWYGMI